MLCRQVGFKLHEVFFCGMIKPDLAGKEGKRSVLWLVCISVFVITPKWETGSRKLHPYLMRAPCFQFDFQKR